MPLVRVPGRVPGGLEARGPPCPARPQGDLRPAQPRVSQAVELTLLSSAIQERALTGARDVGIRAAIRAAREVGWRAQAGTTCRLGAQANGSGPRSMPARGPA